MEIKITPLCVQCAKHEVSSWINEKSPDLKAELARAMRDELRDFTLADGSCIVCNNNRVSYGWKERILRTMKKYQAKDELRQEFLKMFGFEENYGLN